MMNARTGTTAASLGDQFGAAPAAVTLWALKSAYAHLETCIAQVELVTLRPQPDMRSLATARFKISQASLARRFLLHSACDHLLGFATPVEAQTIRSLKRDSINNAATSTEHVRCWPAARVEQEWNAYREASRRIRAMMKQAIRTEQRVLLPLLSHYAQH